MIEFLVVSDDALPTGKDWLQVDFPDGHCAVFLAASGGVVQRSAPITIRGVTFQSVPNNDPFDWEWCRVRMADGTERVLFNRDGLACQLGYALCEDDGTPVDALRLVG